MAHDFMTDPDFLELFPELRKDNPAAAADDAPVKKAPRRTKKTAENDEHIKQAMKTIQWKFKDILSEFPEIQDAAQIKIKSPADIYNKLKPLYDHETVEHFTVVWLSTGARIIGYEIISTGNLNSSIVSPREVFRGAIVASCCNIILIHNHPSNNPNPSPEDVAITKLIVKAGELLDIHVFDHIIFTDNGFFSFTEHGLI